MKKQFITKRNGGTSRRLGNSYGELESRELLAGDVVAFEHGGNLFIRGDAENNHVQLVTDDEGKIQIHGNHGTTINGTAHPFTVESSSTVNHIIGADSQFNGGLRVHMGPGHDRLEVKKSQFNGRSIVFGGAGNDTIDFEHSNFTDHVTVQTHTGNDHVTASSSQFDDELYVFSLIGDDTVVLDQVMAMDDTIIVTGHNNDHVVIDGSHLVGENQLVLTQDGHDDIEMINPVLGVDGVGLFTGTGNDHIVSNLMDSLLGGELVINGQQGTDISEVEINNQDVDQVFELNVEVGDVLFDNGVGGLNGVNYAVPSYFDTANNNFKVASDIRVDETQQVNSITWTGSYGGDLNEEFPSIYQADDFTIEFFEGTSEVPIGAPIASFNVGNEVNRTDTGVIVGASQNIPIYQFSADIDIKLEVGKTYWVSIVGAVQDDVPANSVGGDYTTFLWGIRSLFGTFGDEGLNETNVYTYGDRVTTDPGWSIDQGGIMDFQLRS